MNQAKVLQNKDLLIKVCLRVSYFLKKDSTNFFEKVVDNFAGTVKLGNKELFDKEQIGIKEPLPVTNLPFTS